MAALRIAAFIAGAAAALATLLSAVRVFLLTRATPSIFARIVFRVVRHMLNLFAGERRPFEARDRVLAYFAPLSLTMLLGTWIVVLVLAFGAMFWAFNAHSFATAVSSSGSSLFTLGFQRTPTLAARILSFVEAGIGLGLVAVVITFMPSMYAAFTRRESTVALLEVLAGSPPSTEEFLVRHHRIGALARLDPTWAHWQRWFSDLEQTHTSLPLLCFFRSIESTRSWATAAGCILDAAAITVSSLDIQRDPEAELMIRAGYVALRRISDYFSIQYDPDPSPEDPISIQRVEFEAMWDKLAQEGVPLKRDRDQAWIDFAGWRVNYDTVLLALAALTVAPPAPWSSDRAPARRRPPITRRVGLGASRPGTRRT